MVNRLRVSSHGTGNFTYCVEGNECFMERTLRLIKINKILFILEGETAINVPKQKEYFMVGFEG